MQLGRFDPFVFCVCLSDIAGSEDYRGDTGCCDSRCVRPEGDSDAAMGTCEGLNVVQQF